MRVAVIAVGKRTEHWEGLFRALATKADVEILLQVADVSDLAEKRLGRLAEHHPGLRFRLSPHLLGEDATGHMASVVFRPGSLRGLQAFRPDVIHVIGEPSYLATFQAIQARNRLLAGVPITHYAAQNVLTRFPWPFPALERHAYRHIALALPITPAALSVLRAKGYRGPAEIAPLGVDRRTFAPRPAAPPGPFTAGFVGRLEKHKGIGDLVEACDRLGCRLLVVGDGSLRPWLMDEAARRSGQIQVVPWADHSALPELLARMHALVLPSVEVAQRNVVPWIAVPLREQFGRVLVEAMSCGVPVVATRVGEIPHVVGPSGVLVEPGDPGALAEGLRGLRDVPGCAERLAHRALTRASRYDWDLIADQLVGAWRRTAPPPTASSRDGARHRPPDRLPVSVR